MAFGYRLYTVELKEGQKRPPLKFASTDCGAPGVRYPQYAAELLGAYVTKSWIYVPAVPDAADGSTPAKSPYIGKPVVRIKKIDKPDPNVIVVTFEYGRVGSHTTALGVPDVTADASLENLAPSNEYRAILVTPTVGTTGVLAVEANGRSCPMQPLRAVLRDRARQNARILNEGDDPEAGSINMRAWWQLVPTPIVDQTHLQAVLKDQAAQTSVELTVKTTTGARTRGDKPIKISAASLDGSMRDKVAKTVQGWVKKSTTDAAGAKELAVIIGHGLDKIDLESGLVKVEAGTEAPISLRPSALGDVFTYLQPGGDRQATKTLYKLVGAKVKSIQQAAQLQIDWPDWP